MANSLESDVEVEDFQLGYAFDDDAYRYLTTSPPAVRHQVVRTLKPQREGDLSLASTAANTPLLTGAPRPAVAQAAALPPLPPSAGGWPTLDFDLMRAQACQAWLDRAWLSVPVPESLASEDEDLGGEEEEWSGSCCSSVAGSDVSIAVSAGGLSAPSFRASVAAAAASAFMPTLLRQPNGQDGQEPMSDGHGWLLKRDLEVDLELAMLDLVRALEQLDISAEDDLRDEADGEEPMRDGDLLHGWLLKPELKEPIDGDLLHRWLLKQDLEVARQELIEASLVPLPEDDDSW
eukprot:TRINITY_DN3332_c0_g3_i2.p1 TRINITY_DN3332_c0_g3~~TRINITY_DN3332_c0_g3_i2.p1  ORF type:complete len:311 (+),score=78.43 TRINITY_DN3332_c0_g3_i2:63-935(+)